MNLLLPRNKKIMRPMINSDIFITAAGILLLLSRVFTIINMFARFFFLVFVDASVRSFAVAIRSNKQITVSVASVPLQVFETKRFSFRFPIKVRVKHHQEDSLFPRNHI